MSDGNREAAATPVKKDDSAKQPPTC